MYKLDGEPCKKKGGKKKKKKRRKKEYRKEGNVLFNDALNTFYFTVIWRRTYGKGPLRLMRGNPQPPRGLLLPINSKGSFICTIPQTG